jgi:hypothetical protein
MKFSSEFCTPGFVACASPNVAKNLYRWLLEDGAGSLFWQQYHGCIF